MIAPKLTDEFDIGPNRNIFYVGFLFVSAGLVSGTIADFAENSPISTILIDLISLPVFAVILLLVRLGRIRYAIALLGLLIQAMVVFYVDFIGTFMVQPRPPHVDFSISAIFNLMVTGLFGVVATLVIERRAAYVFVILAVAGIVAVTIVSEKETYFSQQAVMDLATLIGTLMVVFYYRKTLEDLMSDIRSSLLSERSMKEKAEQYNEINRPFVVFGRNAASLAYDFRIDVDEVRKGIEELRQLQRDSVRPDMSVLQRIEDAVSSLNRRIAWVKFATSASEDRGPEKLALRDVAESAVYPFIIQDNLRDKVSIDLEVLAEPSSRGKRLQYLHVVEAIIRSLCSAILARSEVKMLSPEIAPHTRQRRTTLKIRLNEVEGQAILGFEIQGNPLPVCMNCQRTDCSQCTMLRSAVELPMAQAQFSDHLDAIGGFLRIRARPGQSTLVELCLPVVSSVVSR